MRSLRLYWKCGIAVVVVLTVAGWWVTHDRGPEGAKDRFLEMVASQRWEAVVDQLPPPELAYYPSKGVAVALLRRISSRIPKNALANAKVRQLPPMPVENVTQFEITFPNLPRVVDGKEYANTFLLSALRGQGGWMVSLETLPVTLAMHGSGTRAERLNRFADDLDAVHLQRYTVFLMRNYTDSERLRSLARTQKPNESIFLPPGG